MKKLAVLMSTLILVMSPIFQTNLFGKTAGDGEFRWAGLGLSTSRGEVEKLLGQPSRITEEGTNVFVTPKVQDPKLKAESLHITYDDKGKIKSLAVKLVPLSPREVVEVVGEPNFFYGAVAVWFDLRLVAIADQEGVAFLVLIQ